MTDGKSQIWTRSVGMPKFCETSSIPILIPAWFLQFNLVNQMDVGYLDG